MKKLLGVFLCLIPFLALFVVTWIDHGFIWAAGIYVAAFGVAALMWAGVKLIYEN